MTHPDDAGNNIAAPSVANLRVTFWGVQGTCPIFPTAAEVHDYARRIASHTVQQTLLDLASRFENGHLTPRMIRDLATPANAADFQQRLGLPPLPIYGGETTCIQLQTAEGNTLLFDMGTGLRDFSRHATGAWGRPDRTVHVFASHEHLDHRSGLAFSSLCYEKEAPFTVHIYGTRQFLAALDARYGIYSRRLTPAMHMDDPLDFRMMSATFTGTEIRTSHAPADHGVSTFKWPALEAEEPIVIGSTEITPFEVYHGITHCLAYKVRHGNSTFVFCTDHELRHGPDAGDSRQQRSLEAERRLVSHCHHADAAYFDGQYLLAEYTGLEGIGSGPGVSRLDWGHSCIEDIVARVRECGIRRAFIGHHDPDRPWGQRMELDEHLRQVSAGQAFQIELAKAGVTIDL